MSKKVVIILADGFEEIEAVTPIDVLRRAGLNVRSAGLFGKTVTGSHGLKVEADMTVEEFDGSADCLILPGGMPGSRHLNESKKVADLVRTMSGSGKWVAGICAAPALALAPAGVLEGKKATCYPGFENNFSSAVKFSPDRVVVDGNIVTSRGPGTAFDFAFGLVEKLVSKEKADELRKIMLA
ncbi:MAG: DJ-1/PfpI family protein [Candidatus Omnitrophica bacterium]|nr:DJ-1/PfpI family protein [Candidatus Omnitrophota bacterium]